MRLRNAEFASLRISSAPLWWQLPKKQQHAQWQRGIAAFPPIHSRVWHRRQPTGMPPARFRVPVQLLRGRAASEQLQNGTLRSIKPGLHTGTIQVLRCYATGYVAVTECERVRSVHLRPGQCRMQPLRTRFRRPRCHCHGCQPMRVVSCWPVFPRRFSGAWRARRPGVQRLRGQHVRA